jgi:hypothetical protein
MVAKGQTIHAIYNSRQSDVFVNKDCYTTSLSLCDQSVRIAQRFCGFEAANSTNTSGFPKVAEFVCDKK